MAGSNTGRVAEIKAEITDRDLDREELIVFHCVVHQEHLCTKALDFKHVIGLVIY